MILGTIWIPWVLPWFVSRLYWAGNIRKIMPDTNARLGKVWAWKISTEQAQLIGIRMPDNKGVGWFGVKSWHSDVADQGWSIEHSTIMGSWDCQTWVPILQFAQKVAPECRKKALSLIQLKGHRIVKFICEALLCIGLWKH